MREEQMDLSTTERQLLFDIRSESRKANELLDQLLTVLNPIAKGLEPKEVVRAKLLKTVKPKEISKDKPKRGMNNAKNK